MPSADASRRLRRLAALIEDHLLGWVLGAVAVGALCPPISVITRLSTPVLAVMIGGVSLTLSPTAFRRVDPRALVRLLLGHAAMPVVALAVARTLGLSPALTAGFVVLGAVTPELVTPVMTELAGGDTALATTALVATGVGSLAFVPLATSALLGADLRVPTRPIATQLLVAVVAPMALAVGLRARFPDRVGRYDDYYPAVSASMVVLIIGGVTASNAALLRSNADLLLRVGVGAAALNAVGYGLGRAGARGEPSSVRTAATLSVGMRDFAVAAALVVAAELPAVAALPAVAFGVVEMTTSAALARRRTGA